MASAPSAGAPLSATVLKTITDLAELRSLLSSTTTAPLDAQDRVNKLLNSIVEDFRTVEIVSQRSMGEISEDALQILTSSAESNPELYLQKKIQAAIDAHLEQARQAMALEVGAWGGMGMAWGRGLEAQALELWDG